MGRIPTLLTWSHIHLRVQLGAWLGRAVLDMDTKCRQEGEAAPSLSSSTPLPLSSWQDPRTGGPACPWLQSCLE